MEIKLEVLITETKMNINFSHHQGVINIVSVENKEIMVEQPTVYLLLNDNIIVDTGHTNQAIAHSEVDFDKIIKIIPPWEIEIKYLEQLMVEELMNNGMKLASFAKERMEIPANQRTIVEDYKRHVVAVLESFGYEMRAKVAVNATKAKPAKTQHRWFKEVSQVEFFVNSRSSQATVIWQKRNEMLLKAGAKIMDKPPLNKDGTLGFAAKMGEKLRSDYASKITDFITTEDLVLKSVNEVGLFLYFGGTNSWLVLRDANGKTIDEWTRID